MTRLTREEKQRRRSLTYLPCPKCPTWKCSEIELLEFACPSKREMANKMRCCACGAVWWDVFKYSRSVGASRDARPPKAWWNGG